MTSKMRKWISALLALLMVASPIAASLAEDGAQEIAAVEEQAEAVPASEPAPEPVEEAPAPEDEEGEAQSEAAEPSGEEAPEGGAQEELADAEPSDEESYGEGPVFVESVEQVEAPMERSADAEPVYAVSLDASSVIVPVYVPYGAQEDELPLPATLPANFSDGSLEDVPVVWYCTGNSFDGQGYIPECEDRGAVFYFQATPVGIDCSPSMMLPAVTVMYAPSLRAAFDHEAISFAGTEIRIAQGATVTTDDILNEEGYDPSYRIVCEGIIAAGESGEPIPNPVKLSGAIRGGTFEGEIALERGTIRGGTFDARIESARGAIHGGTFNGPIGGPERQIYVSIYGGEFRGDIGDSEYDGYVFVHGGEFYCNVRCRNLTVDGDPVFYNADGKGGEGKTVTLGTVGAIAGGTFYADVLNRNNITGGVFYGKVTNGGISKNCNVLGGVFYGAFDNAVGGMVLEYSWGDYGGAQFPGEAELRNSGELDAGDQSNFSEGMTVINQASGVIRSGVYSCKTINYGSIVGGSFPGGVINMGRITGGSFDGELYNEGGTVTGATLNGLLMSNTGTVTLGGIVADPESRSVTIASGEQVTTDQILTAVGGDAANYTIHNEGEITGGDAALNCDFAPDSLGAISGGSFGGRVCAGAISGGSFSGTVEANSISEGSFSGRVNVRDTISGGNFAPSSVVTAGVIAGGAFYGKITSKERRKSGFITITGGTFTGGVATDADDGIVINGGLFNCNVGYRADAARDVYDGYVIVRRRDGVDEPRFNGEYVGGHNVVTECGVFSENTKVVVYSVGVLAGGTFNGPVICNNAISGGEFHGEVTVNAKPNGQIHGGVFYGRVNNKEGAFISEGGYDGNPPPKFLGGELENEGVMDPGADVEFGGDLRIVNRETGSIRSGVYSAPVRNYGAISRGVFKAPVTSYSSIAASEATFEDIVLDVPAETLTIPAGATKSIDEILAMEGYAASTLILNRGIIAGEGELPNEIENTGTIRSGSYSGIVKGDGTIEGGTFTGEVTSLGYTYLVRIDGGEFNCPVATRGDGDGAVIYGGHFYQDVGKSGDGHILIYRGDTPRGQEDNSKAIFEGKVAARNLVVFLGTFNGPVELSTVGGLDGGVFYGPVTCNNTITAGEFHNTVTIATAPNGQILGGVFYGDVINRDNAMICRDGYVSTDGAFRYGPPQFLGGEIENQSKMDPGSETVFSEDVQVVNQPTGSILSGVYRGPMVNYGTISNAVLYGKVRNEGRIVNSSVLGEISGAGSVSVEGVELDGKTITIQSGYRFSTDRLASLMSGDQSEYTVINGGVILEGDAALGCTVQGGTIRGGSFTGTVYAFAISGGTFDGDVYAKVIQGGVFNGRVRDFNERSAGGLSVEGMEYTGGLSVQGGVFNGRLGGSDRADPIYIHGGDFSGCDGITAWNLTVDAALTGSTVFGGPVEFTAGDIAGGTFQDRVTSYNNITGGIFNGRVVNHDSILGGTFNGGIENHALIKALESYNYTVGEKGEDGHWIIETRTEHLGGTYLNCEVENVEGGRIETGVTWGEGCAPTGSGATYVAAFVESADGSYRIYNGDEFRYGENVQTSLARLDKAQSTQSDWSYLDGGAIGEGATISLDPLRNVFLRESSFDIRDGVLELGDGWSAEGSEPKAEYRSVHIPAGATVSAGNWTHPVTNDGAITGGTFADIVNRGTITGASINGSITASGGSIENCRFGANARVVSLSSGATVSVNFTVGGKSYSGSYGASVLAALNAVREPDPGYQWYNLTAKRAVRSDDAFALSACSYEIRSLPAPEIIWPADAAVAINSALSTASFTDRDPNGSFTWANPGTIVKASGKQYFDMIFTPDAGNRYNYAEMQTRKSVAVQVSERVITVTVNPARKMFSEGDPAYSCTIDGLEPGESINRTFSRKKGEDVGSYEITAEVRAYPAGCTVRVIPGTLTIEPRPLTAAVIAISEGGRKYYPADRYSKSYTGAAIEPSVQVSFLGKALEEGKDYTRSYRANVEPGTAYIDIAGIGNYSGQAYRTFTIGAGKASLSIESCTKEYGAPDPVFRATLSGVADPSLVGYELYRLPGEKVGTYSILARNITGPFQLEINGGGILSITPRQLPESIDAPAAQSYTGAAVTPDVAVQEGGSALARGTDYTVSYENNVNAGIAAAVVTGRGNYAGTRRVQFTILPARAEIRVDSASKNLEEPDPRFTATVTGALGGQQLNYRFERDPGEELGEYAVRAVPGENPNYEITTVPGTLTILPVVTRISLSESEMTLDEGGSGALRYEFYPEVATAGVSFSSEDESVASVKADGTVQAERAGATTVTATTDNGKTASCRVIVRPVAKQLSLANGESTQLSVSERSVTGYTSSETSVAEVDAGGRLTAKKVGKSIITASANGIELAKWELRVTPAPTKIVISRTELELDEGQQSAITAATDEGISEIRWSTNDERIAAVDQEGRITANMAGIAIVTAQSYNGKTASCRVIVHPVAKRLSLANGESAQLSVSGRSVSGYTSSETSVASVDAKGKLTARKVGRTTVTASADGVEIAAWEVEVTPVPTKVILSQESAELGEGQTVQLSADTDEGSKEIEWSSSKESVASVDASGLVTANKEGSATITARSVNGKTAACKIQVSQAPKSIKLSVSAVKIGAGETRAVDVILSKGSHCEVRFESTNPEIAEIRDGMIVAGATSGTATITASTYNDLKASCTVTVTPELTGISLGGDVRLGEKQSLVLPVKLEPHGAMATLSFESSDKKVVTVNDRGELKAGSKGGSAVVTARAPGGISASVNVTVEGSPKGVKLSAKKASIGAGQTYPLSAEIDGAECELTWSSSKKSVADVDQNGLVTAYKAGTAKITAKTYNNKKASCTITVTKAPTSIKLNLTSVTLGVGEQSEKLKATLSKKSSSEISYSFDKQGVAAIEDGRIVGKAPGSVTLTASTYNGLQAVCSVKILAAPTVIDLGEDCSLKAKKALQLEPEFGDGEGGKVSYSTSNKKIATVDASGKVKAKKAGSVTITATAYNGTTGSITITVTKK